MAHENPSLRGVALNTVGAAVLTGLTLPAQGVGAVFAAAGIPLLGAVLEVDERRTRENVQRTVGQAVVDAGLTAEEAVEWLRSDDSRLMLTRDVVQAAMSTLDEQWIRALSLALSTGMKDDAKLDFARLVARALVDLEPVHVSVLNGMMRLDPKRPTEPAKREKGKRFFLSSIEWDFTALRAAFPHLGASVQAVLVGLERQGCITTVANNRTWCPTGFGCTCLNYLNGVQMSVFGD